MTELKIEQNKKGYYVDFSFRRQVDGTNFKEYKRVYLDAGLSKSKMMQQAKYLYAEFLADCEDKVKLGASDFNSSMTLSDFIDFYLEFIKNNYSVAYYFSFCELSIKTKEQIGKYKLKDITPVIIQKFYDYLTNDFKREVVKIMPRPDFKTRISKFKYVGRQFRKICKSHPKYLKLALAGEKVSIEWADAIAKYLGVPFEYFFTKEISYEEYSYCYKKKHATFLRACLSEAKKKLLIKENYAKSEYTKFMKNPNPNKEVNVLKEDDFFKLYDYILSLEDSKRKAFFVIMLNTGARKEEVLGLKWDKINLEERNLTFSTTVTYVGNHGKVINENKTKNASSNRKIGLSEETISVLTIYKKSFQEKYGKDENKFLFLNEEGTDVLHPSVVNRWLNSTLKKVGLEHYSVHSLRHSYASLMINHLPIAEVSKRIGHSQISTTLNIYTHQMNDDRKYKDLKNIVKNDLSGELMSALNLLRQNNLLTEVEFNAKKEIIEGLKD